MGLWDPRRMSIHRRLERVRYIAFGKKEMVM